jgi:GST-like protein
MIDLYYWTTPNGHKITIFLEEAGLRYKIIPVNISHGDQFKLEFLAISPNNRIPAIIDHEPTAASRWRCSNRAPSCFIWQRRPESS